MLASEEAAVGGMEAAPAEEALLIPHEGLKLVHPPAAAEATKWARPMEPQQAAVGPRWQEQQELTLRAAAEEGEEQGANGSPVAGLNLPVELRLKER